MTPALFSPVMDEDALIRWASEDADSRAAAAAAAAASGGPQPSSDELHRRLDAWPPYQWVEHRRDEHRYRLHDRDSLRPPCDAWVSTVMCDWLVHLYKELRCPLEPMMRCIREAVREDTARDLDKEAAEAEAAAAAAETDKMQPPGKFSEGLRLPRLAEHTRRIMRCSLLEEVQKFDRAVGRMGDYYMQGNPLRRLVCDSWMWWWFGKPDTVYPLPLECFVEQGSPCCAAASSSGALNVVLRRPRHRYVDCNSASCADCAAPSPSPVPPSRRSYRTTDSLAVMETHLFEMCVRSSLQTGVGLTDAQLRAVSEHAAGMLSPGGTHYYPPPTTKPQQAACLKGIRDHLLALGLRETAALATLRWNEDGTRPPCKASVKELYTLLSNVWGLAKLKAQHPSTARLGSWGVQMAVERLSAKGSLSISCATQNANRFSWAEFSALLSRPNCAVVVHLPNHYAVVFGVREPRQVITARKGQPPTDLVSWTEIQAVQARSTEGCLIIAYHQACPPPLKTSSKASLSSNFITAAPLPPPLATKKVLLRPGSGGRGSGGGGGGAAAAEPAAASVKKARAAAQAAAVVLPSVKLAPSVRAGKPRITPGGKSVLSF